MMKTFTFLVAGLLSAAALAQTTVYETGSGVSDPWTGWSTPVTYNCSGAVGGPNTYQFTGTNGQTYTFELYRQFLINSNDIDVYLAASTQNATISVEYSTDNVSYTQIGTQNWASGYAQSTIVIPTYDAGGITSFYLKIKGSGTFGSPSNTQLNTFKIDAVLNSNGVDEFDYGTNVLYSNGMIQMFTTMQQYTINIFNLGGQKIASEVNMTNFDMSGFQKGIYFVNVMNKEGEQKTFKIAHQ